MALETREKALRALEVERDTLMSELEELDRQNQEATQVCLTTAITLEYEFIIFFLKFKLASQVGKVKKK